MSAPAGDRWEMGSLFHAAAIPPGGEGEGAPWSDREHLLTGSGRDALRLAVEARSPERVWVPTYLCQEVVETVTGCAGEVLAYPDSPLDPASGAGGLDLRAGDAVLTVAYFGVRGPRIVGGGGEPLGFDRDAVVVIEDHTHDPTGPLATDSDADFCIASLRKLWPLPDGGVLWSPRALPLPDPPGVLPDLELASGVKLAGMEMKSRYLRGEPVPKPLFRELLDRGERTLHGAGTSGMTEWSRGLLDALPLGRLREERRRRFERLVDQVPDGDGYRVLRPPSGENGEAPFSAFFVFDDAETRDRVHGALVEARLFASRLWPLDRPILRGVRESDVGLSRRSFSVPVDMRYGPEDMDRAAAILNDAIGRAP